MMDPIKIVIEQNRAEYIPDHAMIFMLRFSDKLKRTLANSEIARIIFVFSLFENVFPLYGIYDDHFHYSLPGFNDSVPAEFNLNKI